jgi:ribosomal protein S18 acetylase RimI-like enzyme
VSFESARLGTAEDLDAIEWLGAAVTAPLPDQRGGVVFSHRELGFSTPAQRSRRAMDETDGLCVVGEFDGVTFGYGVALIEPLDDGSLLGRLLDFAVHPQARGVGIGEAMMNLVVEELRAAGCGGVDAWALPGDRATKNFFETFGLKARLLTAHKAL